MKALDLCCIMGQVTWVKKNNPPLFVYLVSYVPEWSAGNPQIGFENFSAIIAAHDFDHARTVSIALLKPKEIVSVTKQFAGEIKGLEFS